MISIWMKPKNKLRIRFNSLISNKKFWNDFHSNKTVTDIVDLVHAATCAMMFRIFCNSVLSISFSLFRAFYHPSKANRDTLLTRATRGIKYKNVPQNKTLKEERKKSIAKNSRITNRFFKCVHAYSILVYFIRAYIVTHVNISVFVYIWMYVCVFMCMCMYHGSAEDIRTRFSKLLKSAIYMRKWDILSYSRMGKIQLLSNSMIYISFRIFENLPSNFFPIWFDNLCRA